MLDALPLENIASFGPDIDGLIAFIWWIVAGWLIVAEAALVYALIFFRKKDGVRASWLPGRSTRAMAWVLVPTLLVSLFDFAIEAQSATVWDRVKTDIPPHELLVRITGRQFVWSFTYAGADGELDTADDFQTVTELHVPQGKVVRFQLEAVDVLSLFLGAGTSPQAGRRAGSVHPGLVRRQQERPIRDRLR
jgi:heme/copper-type cytochrome/quinol oxidase subunit 2